MTTTPETRVVPQWLLDTIQRVVDAPTNPHSRLTTDYDRAAIKAWLGKVKSGLAAAPAAPAPEPVAHPVSGDLLPDEVWADPGRRGWYFREKMSDSVARYVRADAVPPAPVAASAVDGADTVDVMALADQFEAEVLTAIDFVGTGTSADGDIAYKDAWEMWAKLRAALAATPPSPNPVADNPAGDPVVNAPMSLWAAAAQSMLATYNAFMDGDLHSPEDRASFEHLLLAASFGAQAFDDAPPIARGGGEVSLLLKAFCRALIDPSDKDLDHLRANYAPPPAAEGSR